MALAVVTMPPAAVREAPVSLMRSSGGSGIGHGRDVVWVLLLGSDARPGQRVTRSRADAIQLAGVNVETGDATIIGVPRDSYVDLPGAAGRNKINLAMVTGGPRRMGRAVGNLVGLQPDYVLTAGFDGFRRMVRGMGGVTVRSDFAFADPVRPQGYRVGPNRLTGFQALIFARIRKSFPRGDFDRSANQQDLLRGILAEVRGKADRPGFMERGVLSVIQNMDTDLRPAELYTLAQAATQVELRRVRGCVIGGRTGYAGAASVVYPDVAQARRLAADARRDGRLDRGC